MSLSSFWMLISLSLACFAGTLFAEDYDYIYSDELRIYKSDQKKAAKRRKKKAIRKKLRKNKRKRVRRKKKRRSRKLSSLRTARTFSSAALYPEHYQDWNFSVSLMGGSSSSSYAQNFAPGGNSLTFGAALDLRYSYFGLEVDGYNQNLPMLRNLNTVSLPTGTATSDEAATNKVVGSASLKGQYPIYWRNFRLTPKAGVGYSIFNVRTAGSNDAISFGARGIHAMVGLDMLFFHRVRLAVDYILGLATSASGVESIDAPNFDRIRAALFYQFSRMFSAGVQYNRDTFEVPQQVGDSSNQILGAVQLNF